MSRFPYRNAIIVGFLVLSILTTGRLVAQTESVIYTFPVGSDGLAEGNPYASPILDTEGNLYGTAVTGGAYGYGSVFKLSPTSGHWSETTLHSFNSDGQDGTQPYSSLVMDSSGNIYGTTYSGGAYNLGTVFELHPNTDNSWRETVLHSFNVDGSDGYYPYANLIFDKAGNLYGTTYSGGSGGEGAVFELSPGQNGAWLERVILDLNYTDGAAPYGGLVFDATGRLYGATQYGGLYEHGVVFVMERSSKGTWTEQVLHSFDPSTGDGWAPYAGLVIDKVGHLYGTTLYGGSAQQGTVFEVAFEQGTWQETVIHTFSGYVGDGINPYGPLAIDPSGNLYGTTWQSQFPGVGGAGIVFGLSQTKPNVWQEAILHNFVNPGDGGNPYSGVALDSAGHVFGTTYYGGAAPGTGVVFEIKKLTTITSVASSLSSSTFGQLVTFEATVKGSSGTPTGTVTFKNGSAELGTKTLLGGVAKYTTAVLPVGMDSISAIYGGSPVLAPSKSNVLKQVVSKATTSTTVVSSINPSTFGGTVTFTATVKPEFSGVPSGIVTFKNGTTTRGTGKLDSGVAKYTTSALPVGTNPITAAYEGSTAFDASTSTVLEEVVDK